MESAEQSQSMGWSWLRAQQVSVRARTIAVERIGGDPSVDHEVADLSRLVADRIVQRVGANIAPEAVEAVAGGSRSRARQVEDA